MLGWIVSLLAVVGLAIFCFYYLNWLKPKRMLAWYKQTLEGLGYNVVTMPFTPLKIASSQLQKYNQKQFGDCSYDEKHKWHNYDLVLANTGNIPTLILLKPALLQSFFSPDKQPFFYKSLSNKVAFNIVLKNSLILNQDQKWKRKRKIFTDILNFQFVKAKIPKMVQIIQKTFQQLENQNSKDPKPHKTEAEIRVFLAQHYKAIIAEIVIKLFFGCDAADLTLGQQRLNVELSSILVQARNQSSDWLVLIFGEKAYDWGLSRKYRSLLARIQKLRQKVRELLELKMQRMPQKMSSYNDLFESLFFLKQKSNSEEDVIEMQQFISQFCAFLTAANDSTGNYINMLMYYLSQHPHHQNKLQRMLRDKFKHPEQIEYYQLRDIDYFDWCLYQTTRMYGPATNILLRQAKTDTYIDNIPILKSTGIKIELLASHYNPKIYKDPFTFDPTRWSVQDPENHPYSFGGFGGGAHSCLGKQLALLASKLLVSVMLLRYDKVEIEEEAKIEMVCRGIYQPTPFKSILHIRQPEAKAQEGRQQVQRREQAEQARRERERVAKREKLEQIRQIIEQS